MSEAWGMSHPDGTLRATGVRHIYLIRKKLTVTSCSILFTFSLLGPCDSDPRIVQDTSPDLDRFSAINTLANVDIYDDHNTYLKNRANWLGRDNQAAHFVIDLGCEASLSTLVLRNSGDGTSKSR